MSDNLWPHGQFATPWTIACQLPVSMEFSRQGNWSVVIPFSRGSSQPRDWTQVSCTAGGFFIVWATGKPSHLGNTYPNKNELLLHSHCVCLLLSVMCDTLWPHRLASRLSVHGILQARRVVWVAISSSRESSWPRDQTRVFCVSCNGRQILYH